MERSQAIGPARSRMPCSTSTGVRWCAGSRSRCVADVRSRGYGPPGGLPAGRRRAGEGGKRSPPAPAAPLRRGERDVQRPLRVDERGLVAAAIGGGAERERTEGLLDFSSGPAPGATPSSARAQALPRPAWARRAASRPAGARPSASARDLHPARRARTPRPTAPSISTSERPAARSACARASSRVRAPPLDVSGLRKGSRKGGAVHQAAHRGSRRLVGTTEKTPVKREVSMAGRG